jgi:ADP-ribose pyrophosphatase YjhB (NUDIX family)
LRLAVLASPSRADRTENGRERRPAPLLAQSAGDLAGHLARQRWQTATVEIRQGFPARRAARVILLDPDDRVLLLRYDQPPPNGRHWATPGGGAADSEDYHAAAARELTEETGWSDIELIGEVFRCDYDMDHAGQMVHQVERLYLARTDRREREISGVAAMHAADGIAAWRWWTLDELESTDEDIWPAGLASLIRSQLGN